METYQKVITKKVFLVLIYFYLSLECFYQKIVSDPAKSFGSIWIRIHNNNDSASDSHFSNCVNTKGNWCKLTNRYQSGIFVVKSNSHRLILSNMIKSKARKESHKRTIITVPTYLMLTIKSGDTQIWKTIGFSLRHGYKYDIHGLPNALMVFLVSAVCNWFISSLCLQPVFNSSLLSWAPQHLHRTTIGCHFQTK